ncbi:hypothetical protein ALC56_04282, partial [Trachymyrmex septentrionalis]
RLDHHDLTVPDLALDAAPRTPAQLMQRWVSRDLVAPDASGYQRYPGSPAGCYTGGFVYRHRGRGQANVALCDPAEGFRDGTPGIEHRG